MCWWIESSPCKHSSHRAGHSGGECFREHWKGIARVFRGRTTAPTGCGGGAGIKKPGQLVAARAGGGGVSAALP